MGIIHISRPRRKHRIKVSVGVAFTCSHDPTQYTSMYGDGEQCRDSPPYLSSAVPGFWLHHMADYVVVVTISVLCSSTYLFYSNRKCLWLHKVNLE